MLKHFGLALLLTLSLVHAPVHAYHNNNGAAATTAAAEMSWEAGRRLSWDDFQGPVRHAAGSRTAAETVCGIGFETSHVSAKERPQIFVYNTFYINRSWVRPDQRKPQILAHEQGHFDICELYTRILRSRMERLNVTGSNMKSVLGKVYNEVQAEYRRCQDQYEADTQHGIIAKEQQRWQEFLEQQLSETRHWASR